MSQPPSDQESPDWLATARRLLGGEPDGHPTPPLLALHGHGCRVTDTAGRTFLDLTSGAGLALLGHAHEAVLQACADALTLGLACESWHPLALEVAALLLQAFPALEVVRLYADETAARHAAAQAARATTGQERLLSLHNAADLEQLGHELPEDLAAVEVLPEGFDPAEWDALADACARLRERGILVLVDATRSAFRLTVWLDAADLVCLGESLAQGLGFGAVLGLAHCLAAQPGTLGGHPVALAAVRATLQQLRDAPVAATLAEIGLRLQSTFEQVCAGEHLLGRLDGAPGCLRLTFDDQLNATGDPIRTIYLQELAKAGIRAGPRLYPAPVMTEEDIAEAEQALHHAAAQTRFRLESREAFVSGGRAYPFLTAYSVVRRRGLVLHRDPYIAAAHHTHLMNRVRLRFEPADLGDLTSAGFYVDTLLSGDFRVTLRYHMARWEPGERGAAFGFSATNHDRTYSCSIERVSEGQGSQRLEVAMAQQPPPQTFPVEGDDGELRLTRTGYTLTASHRIQGAWEPLRECAQADPGPLRVGAAIWGSGPCGELEVEIIRLTIDYATIGNQLEEPAPFREDPRCYGFAQITPPTA